DIAGAILESAHTDVRVEALVLGRCTRADLQEHRIALRAVLQVMAVGHAGLETNAVPRAKDFLAGVRHEHDLAFEDVDEFVLMRVPMPLTGPGPRSQTHQVHPELRKARRVPEAITQARCAGLIVWRRIRRAPDLLC